MVRGSHLGFALLSVLALACGRSSKPSGPGPATGAAGATGGTGTAGAGGSGAGGGRAGSGSGATGGAGESGEAGAPGGSGNEPLGTGVSLEDQALYLRVVRLTNSQWDHAVTDILRLPAPSSLSGSFEGPIIGPTTFSNNESVLSVNERVVADFEAAAEAAAELATSTPEALAALYPGTDAEGFVQTFGRRAFRRPLTSEELATYTEAFALGETIYGSGFENGAAFVIRAMLQSPHFLYRSELGPGGEPLTSYEIASKLSFFLLDTTPSDALLDAAEANALATPEQLEALAREMLETPAAAAVLRDLHGQAASAASVPSRR